MKVLQVVGYSNSGKTTLASKIIKELKNRSYTVSSAKSIGCGRGCANVDSCNHEHRGADHGFSLDSPGTDTRAHTQAGSNLVVSWSRSETAIIHNRQLNLDELIASVDTDYLVIEGGKRLNLPRIISLESKDQLKGLKNDLSICVSGKISDQISHIEDLPVYKTFDEIEKIVDLVEENVLETIAYQDYKGCRLCDMTCDDLLDEIYKGDGSPKDCLRMYPEILGSLDQEDKDLISKALLKSDKFYKKININ